MKKVISTFIFCLAIWLLLAGFSVPELIVGVGVSLILAILLGQNSVIEFGFDALIILVKFILIYIPAFMIELIKANLDVAKRVLSPQCPVNPGFVRIKTALKGDFAKLLLGNSITLTPGTITLDIDDESVLVHWIDVKGDSEDDYQKHISGKFEGVLGGIFNDD